MGDLNVVIISGRLGRDAEVRSTAGGKAVAKLSIATERRFKGKNDEWQGVTTWHDVVWWSEGAQRMVERGLLRKGDRVTIEGSIEKRSYEKDGRTVWVTEVRAHNVICNPEPRTQGGGNKSKQQDDDDQIPF